MGKPFEIGDSVFFLYDREVIKAKVISLSVSNLYCELDYKPCSSNITRNVGDLYETESEAYIALTKLLVESLSNLESKIDHLESEVRDLNSATFTAQSSW